MKKILFLIAFLFSSTLVFAGEQYAPLSEVLEWRYGPCFGTTQANADDHSKHTKMKIVDWVCEEDKPNKEQIKTLTDEYLASQDYWVKRFNSKNLMGNVYEQLSTESTFKLAPYAGALQSMMDWDNFSGIKALIDGLVAQETMTSDEKTIIYQCFLDQGIDLTLWGE